MHVNVCTLVGRVAKAGPKLSYASNGTPSCTFTLEVEELSKEGKVFTTWIPVEISGRYAESTASDLDGGDEILIAGKLKYKSVVDPKTQAKSSKLIVSSWGVANRVPAQARLSDAPETSDQGAGAIVEPE